MGQDYFFATQSDFKLFLFVFFVFVEWSATIEIKQEKSV